mgnify:CR=1 FL=1
MNAWAAFQIAHKALEALLSEELESACGLPLSWFDVLGQLRIAPEQRLTMTELAASIWITPSGLTRLVDRMEEEDLVQRVACPGDRRSLHIALTDAGRERFEEAIPIHLDTIERHFAGYISDSEAGAVESALLRIATAVAPEHQIWKHAKRG